VFSLANLGMSVGRHECGLKVLLTILVCLAIDSSSWIARVTMFLLIILCVLALWLLRRVIIKCCGFLLVCNVVVAVSVGLSQVIVPGSYCY